MAKVMRVISDELYQELMTSLNSHEREKKDEKKTTFSVENIEKLIPSRQQKRVKKLLHFFQTSTNIQWSDNGEIILQDIPIHNSNIVDYLLLLIGGPIGGKELPDYWINVTKHLMTKNPPLTLFSKYFIDKMNNLSESSECIYPWKTFDEFMNE